MKGFFCKWEWERTKHIEWNKMHINTKKKKNRRKKYNMYTNLYLIALTLEIFKFVIIIYTNNIIDIIFSMYTYIFIYGKAEGGGWLDNYCHALKRVYKGFLILKIKFYLKNTNILLTSSWIYSINLLNSFNNILPVSLEFFKFTNL